MIFNFSSIINSGEVSLLLILIDVPIESTDVRDFLKWVQLYLIVLLMRGNLMKTNRWSI